MSTQLRSGNSERKPEEFSLSEFYRRVGEREGALEPEQSARNVRAVMDVLSQAASDGELSGLQRQLPEEFEPLFNRG